MNPRHQASRALKGINSKILEKTKHDKIFFQEVISV